MSEAAAQGVLGRRRAPNTRWPVRRWIMLIAVVEAVLLAGAIVTGAAVLSRLGTARTELVDHISPQVTQAQNLTSALLNQQTAIAGYMLTGRSDFVPQYQEAKRQQL